MWSQWPTAAVPSAPPPQPSIPPPLPDAPPPPPPVDNAPAAGPLTSTAVTSAMPGSYVSTGAAQSASNPYEQYTADQYAAMTPEQQYALQQHWQQWQTYQQEYAKWHAQYGEQYKREMAAAAATSTAVPQPAVAPTVQPIGPVYQPAQIGPQMPVVQQAQPQNYYSQTPMQPLPSQMPAQMPAQMPTQMPTQMPAQMPPQSQTTMPGKIMAQPQLYNQPPPPPPHAYQPQQQHLSQPYQQPLAQPPAQNQWQQPPAVPPGRVSQMPPVTYTQPANAGRIDTGGFPNMQQPPPSFMQQPPPTASAPTLTSSNTIDPSWSKEAPNRSNDGGNMGSDVTQPPRNNRWQGNEPGNNNSFNNTGNNMNNQNVNKPNQFGERRSWSGNNNNNTRNNPFNTGSSNKFGSDDGEAPSAGNFDRDTDTGNSGNFGGQSGNNARYGSKLGNNSFGQEQTDNFGQGNRRSGRWEPNRSNQSGGNFGPPRNNNNNRGQNHPNQPHYTQQQQQQQQQQELNFDRLFQQWEKQFEDWKRANANHPDRDEYRRYEEEFENQRRRIAERREQMRRKMQNLHQQQQQQQPLPNQQEPHQQQPHRQQQQNQQSHQQNHHQLQRQPYQQQPAVGSGGNRFASDLEIGEGYDDEDDNSSIGDIDQRQEQKQPQYPDTKKPSDMLNNSAKSDSHFASLNKGAQQRQPQQPAVTKQQQQQKQPSLQQKPQQTSPHAPVATPSNQIPQQQNQHIEKKTVANPNPSFAPPSDTGAGAGAGLGKRKVDAVRATPVKQDNILIISLDDDDDEVDEVQQQSDNDEESANDTPIKNIFKKSGGIPGLDLVTDAEKAGAGAVATPGPTKPTNQNVDNNKKIPSLFDVVIPNPSDSTPSQQSDKEVSTVKIDGESLPDTVTNALKDPNFMNNLSQALAQAQGREREPQAQESKDSSDQTNNTSASGRALSFAEWKNNQKNSQKNGQRNNPDDDFEPGLGQIDNEKANRGPDNIGFGPDQGPPHGFNPNNSMSSDGAQVAGPNSIDFSGPPQGDFRGNGPPNRPNFGGPNSGGPNFGPQGPGGFGGGPGPNGPFGRNFGPPGPNFNGPNGPGPNFGQQFPGNGPGPFRSNFCGPNGPGPGQNFGGPGPFDGPFDRNFGQGPNGPNDRNFGPGRGPNNQNFNNNNRNNSVSENPFKRKGPPMNNFDDGPRNGPGFGQRGRGQMRNFGPSRNNDNNNQWNDGGRSFRGGGVGQGNTFNRNNRNMQQQRGRSAENNFNNIQQCNDSVYRPMQVFDYQNSRNTAPQVIDYGHKSADSAAPRIGMGIGGAGTSPAVGNASALPHFRPGVSFDYGHASHNAPTVAGPTGPGAGPINRKRKNKKRNKNRQRLLQQQQTQPQQPELQPNQDSTTSVDNECNDPEQTAAKANSLEDISDGEEDSMATVPQVESPPPPPPKMPKQEKPKAFPANPQRRMLNDPLPALFPSTAEANKQLPQQTADVHRLEMSVPTNENRNTISIEEVLLPPGRLSRPKRICIILRGPPGCGKSYVARLIKDKELEMGGANPRVLSIDDYFIIENDYEEKCPKTGKKIPKKEMLYEYDAAMEETYMQYLIKSFKKTLTDNLYDFVIVDCNNNSLRTLNEFYCNAKDSNFVPYIVDMHCDVETCLGRNSHQRSEADIRAVLNNWCATPFHYIKLDVSTLLENVIEMEDVEDMATDDNANSEQAVPDEAIADTADDIVDDDSNSADTSNDCGFLKSKWESDNTEENLARLDGTKRLMEKRKTASMADYLQLDDWEPPKVSADGKKRVRWADIEEKRAQQKMRAIGFVVGQTDWKRMMDPNAGNRALNKTKYIERVNKRR